MIRRLAQCPYCQGCEIALDDQPGLVFNPDAPAQEPCPHLAWVVGRYSQWEHTALGINRVIGSTEFRWDPPVEEAAERTEELMPYLKELLESGPGWPFAPTTPFAAQALTADEKAADKKGKQYLVWDVDGWVLFAEDPAAFWVALPDCMERQLRSLDVEEGG
jgi:hypothetical protein